MSQLRMRRASLQQLPGMPLIEPGYVLRTYEPQDLGGLTALMAHAFGDDSWTVERVRNSLTDAPDITRTFVVTHGETLVATASARLLPEQYPGSGYLHWVAAHPNHSGKRLGYIVSLAVLREFTTLGCMDALLETDDQRLTAIVVYRQLGFEPEHIDDTHVKRWQTIDAQIRPQGQFVSKAWRD